MPDSTIRPSNLPAESAKYASAEDIRNFANEAAISMGGKVGGRVISILVDVLLARILGPSIFGLYAIGTNLMRFVSIISPLGLQNGVIWFGTKFREQDRPKLKGVLVKSVVIAAVAGVLTFAIFWVGAEWLAQVYRDPRLVQVIRLFALIFPFITLLKVLASATRITQKLVYSLLTEDFVQPLLNMIFLSLLFFVSWKLEGAILASLFSFVIVCLLGFYFVYRLFFWNSVPGTDLSTSTGELLSYSLPTAMTGTLSSTINWADRLIIGLFLPSAAVGVYQMASQSSMLFVIILYSLNAIFAPMIADLYQKNEMNRLSEIYSVSTKWGLYLGVPAFIVIAVASREILVAILGEAYASGATAMFILNLGQLINLATGAVAFLLIMTGNQKIWLAVTGAAVVLSISLNIVLTPILQINGVALATSISVSAMFLAGLFIVRNRLGIWPYDRRFLKGIISFALTTAVIFAINYFFGLSSLIYLVVLTIVSYGVFFAIIFLMGLDSEDLELIQMFKEKVLPEK